MFGDTFQQLDARKKNAWTLVASTSLQAVLVGIAILVPLVNYYELPKAEVLMYLTAPAPPPPAPPPPPPSNAVAPKPIPRQFDAGALAAPVAVPEQVALIQEQVSVQPVGGLGVVGGMPGGTNGDQIGGVLGSILASAPRVAAPSPPPAPPQTAPSPRLERIRVDGVVQKANLLRQVTPDYPALARRARIQGTVKLKALIARDGTVQELDVIQGHPLLIPAAIQAVKQWRYRPTLLNGNPVEVLTQIDVNFLLREAA